MKKHITLSTLLCALGCAAGNTVSSPDGRLVVTVDINGAGSPTYVVTYDGNTMLEPSPLGLVTDLADYTKGLSIKDVKESKIDKVYHQDRIKSSNNRYVANEARYTMADAKGRQFDVVFRVSDNDVALRYELPQTDGHRACVVEKEATGFNFPSVTTTFLSPQSTPLIGWKRSKPSYEEEYNADQALSTPSKYGVGYTFPVLFHIGDKGWALVSETGVNSAYCGSRLSDGDSEGIYTIAFPQEAENNHNGTVSPGITLPGVTPWRTITVGADLAPIVETTIPFDVVDPLYEASTEYVPGKSTWSWILWQDDSANYDDQVAFIDFAAAMGYKYCLVDAFWDTNIGYKRMEELLKYARSKGVELFLWYNSNGYWNDTVQGPVNIMANTIARKKEMKWLKEHGVKGLKVDFFGGDKQQTMKLYEDILSDANDYGLMIIFHGCTLPRGWERMYPNYVGSEAVLASENLIFQQHFCDMEAFNATLHPFIRNAVGSMEYGGTFMNKRMNRGNDGGNYRRTSDIFQLALTILYQNSIQNFALAPNNLADAPGLCIDYLKDVPTTWDETVFVDGYPGKYVVLARRRGMDWYVGGVNATDKPLKLDLALPMLAGKKVSFYSDSYTTAARKEMKKADKRLPLATDFVPAVSEITVNADGSVPVTILPSAGIVLKTK